MPLGDDTVAIAQRGAAEVVGVDFSPPALAHARALAAELGVSQARFIEADVLRVPEVVPPGAFDLVFTSWGTITWLPDLRPWAAGIAHALRPGGAFLFADAHPAALVFDGWREDGHPAWTFPYFAREPLAFDDPGDYANPAACLANSRVLNWVHPRCAAPGWRSTGCTSIRAWAGPYSRALCRILTGSGLGRTVRGCL